METSALFGSSAWLVIGVGVVLALLGRIPRIVAKNANTITGSGNTVNQNIHIGGAEKPPGDSLLSQASSVCTIVGLVIVILQILKIIV
ncbi:MAG: hypothetical protein WC091_17315 [Sulfuricellaceae bacterium]